MREIKFRAWDKDSKKMFKIARFDFSDYTIYSHLFACDGYLGESCEIMQYTGLKDRNGVEVYEHDIFRFGGRNYVIMYNLGSFGCFEDDKYFPLEEIFYRNGEVVGNIYENPELLEREAE